MYGSFSHKEYAAVMSALLKESLQSLPSDVVGV